MDSMTLSAKATQVKSIKAEMIPMVNFKIILDTSVAIKVIDLKMLKNEINRVLLESEI